MTSEEWEKAARRTAEDLKRRDEEAMKFIMENEQGRWFIGRLLENCHINSPMGADSLPMQEGERRIGLLVRNNIMAMNGGLALMHKLEDERAQVEVIHKHIREEVHKEFEGGYYDG